MLVPTADSKAELAVDTFGQKDTLNSFQNMKFSEMALQILCAIF